MTDECKVGSLNDPAGSPAQLGTNNSALTTYKPQTPVVGNWQISSLSPDQCAINDQARQAQYVAEQLSISGAPLNVFKLLGVHEQGNGSVLSQGKLFASAPAPGYPLTGVNAASSWRSLQTGSSVVSTAFIGIDFGIKLTPTGTPQYDPQKSKLVEVAALNITQGNTPNEWAKQVRVDITDGTCTCPTTVVPSGAGNGLLTVVSLGKESAQGTVFITATSPQSFNVYFTPAGGATALLGVAYVGVEFNSFVINIMIAQGASAFTTATTFTIPLSYDWKRAAMFSLVQSPNPQLLNLKQTHLVKAVRVVPTLFVGTGSWEVAAFDVMDSAPSDINTIQDLFFNENRDRDYAKEPVLIKAQYSPSDSVSDLSKFGLSILDQYAFTVSFDSIAAALGRPIVVGDIIEVIPEMQYDQNFKPVRKFLEVTSTSWAAEGYSTFWKPTVMRFAAEQALPSQETRDIFGTLDTQKYMVADSIFDGIGSQLDTTPLTQTEEIQKTAANKVPAVGSDDEITTVGVVLPAPAVLVNPKGQDPQPAVPQSIDTIHGLYVEAAMPPDNQPYGEGYALPDATTAKDGDYFRLYYPEDQKIAPRLYRFSLKKNRWLYLETDRRGDYSSHKPSVRSILQSSTKQGLGKKL
jgi:hypothetical protein